MAGVTVPFERIDAGAPSRAPAILVVDDIVKRFETPDGVLTAVDHVSLSVAPGEFVGVIGPSGCGKSTLFNVIGGLLDGYEGTVKVAGERVRGPHPSIGMIFQEESTFPWRNVIDNVAFPLEIAGLPKAERYERARHFVRLVGLDGFERRYPAELSGGMRQRVSMARTLAAQPKILLMDEPFASLDEQTRLLLGDKVLQIQQQLKQTTLLITHNITEAVQLSDRILVMTYRPGKVKRIVEIKLPRPRSSEIVSSEAFGRYVAQIWSDLREEASRGLRGRGEAEAARGREAMSAASAALRQEQVRSRPRSGSARSSRSSCWSSCSSASALINRFIVPMPSDIIAAFPRVIVEEHVLHRFLLTASEAFSASILVTIVGVAGGVLLYRYRLLRLATETWVAAIAAAPLVLMYPLYLVIFGRSAAHHRDDGLHRRARAGHPQDARGPVRHAARADQCGQELQSHPLAAVLEDPVPGGAADHLRRPAAGADLRPDQHRRGRVPDQFRRARAAYQRACRALRSAGNLCRDLLRDPGQRVRVRPDGKA